MAVPENLPELLRGEMKYDGLNNNYIESEDTVESKHENEPIDCEKNMQAEFLDDATDMCDKNNKDDLKSIRA